MSMNVKSSMFAVAPIIFSRGFAFCLGLVIKFFVTFLVMKSSCRDRELVALHRGSYMSAHVLLNLLNELGKRDKMLGRPCILTLFRNLFKKFNNTRALMLDSIYHMTLRLL